MPDVQAAIVAAGGSSIAAACGVNFGGVYHFLGGHRGFLSAV
jgi:hypothetical protein